MDRIAYRELRNSSSEILARVEAGETIEVTNKSRLAAVLSPPAQSPLEQAIKSGRVRRARVRVDFTNSARIKVEVRSEEIRADLRGDR